MALELKHVSPRRALPAAEHGFSLLEALVAGWLLLAIVLGIQPLFTRATINNVAGFDYTRVTNMARSRAEQLHQLPFNSDLLTLETGTERVLSEYFAAGSELWKAGNLEDAQAAGDEAMWARTATVRQFNINDLESPLDAAAAAGAVHLKEIVIAVVPTSGGGAVGPRKRVTFRLLKAR